jgi:hypothetical protein
MPGRPPPPAAPKPVRGRIANPAWVGQHSDLQHSGLRPSTWTRAAGSDSDSDAGGEPESEPELEPALQSDTDGPGPPGAVKRPSHSPR